MLHHHLHHHHDHHVHLSLIITSQNKYFTSTTDLSHNFIQHDIIFNYNNKNNCIIIIILYYKY